MVRKSKYIDLVLSGTEILRKGLSINEYGNLYEGWFKDGKMHGRGR